MATTSNQPGRRARDAAATRGAILDAARNAFSCEGYDTVGVREIAAAAGVDPALVIRYFGSKENLFAAAVLSNFAADDILDGDRPQLAARLARMLATKQLHPGFDPMLAIIRSSLSQTTCGMIRDVIDEQIIAPFAAHLGGPDAETRAALLMSQMLGLFMGRLVLQNRALATTDADTLAAYLQPVIQFYIDGLEPAPAAEP